MKLLLTFAVCLLLHQTKGQLDSDDYENCMFLGNNQLKVAWTVDRLKQQINFLLCECQQSGQVSSTNEYMGFGLSGSNSRTLMFGADPTIVWVDDNDGPQAVDYYLSGYTQCRGGIGACPDSLDSSENCTNDVSSVSGFKRNGVQCVAYSKSYQTGDTTCDTNIDPDNENQYIVWALGPLGETAFKHFLRAEATEPPIHFGRTPDNQCRGGTGSLTCVKCDPFEEKTLDLREEDATIVANIGPTGNERGYQAIADQASWGIAWYLNGTLIPRLIVQRNRQYTFISEGGSDDTQSGFYHPFYITDSKSGGRLLNTEAQRSSEVVYAGFDKDGAPLGIGPYCEYTETADSTQVLNNCGSFQEYLNSLVKSPCQTNDKPRNFTWIPDDTTPDTVYYQCATHLNLGFEITVEPPLSTIVSSTTAKPPTPTCPTGMVFNSCGTACPLTCDNFRDAPLPCTRQCVYGCFCSQGKVLNDDGACVDRSNCPTPLTTTSLPPTCVISETLEVGQLPTLAHQVSGTLQIVSSSRLLIKNFNYDGRGPDTFIYYYPPGVQANRRGTGGMIIPFSDTQRMFPFGRRYTNEDFVINLPDGLTVCDIGTFTIWCRRFTELFTSLKIPQSIFSTPTTTEMSKPPTPLTTTSLPPTCVISETLEVGQLPTLAHQVSGTLQIVSSSQLLIKNFNYDGTGPDTFIYYYPPGVQANRRGTGGMIIPFSDTREMFPIGRRYTNEDFVINLPDGLTVCDIGTFTIWCRRFTQLFTSLEIPQSIFSTPTTTEMSKPPTPTCPTGMVFNSCGTACPLTCDNFRDVPLPCTRQCVPSCFCTQGKVLNDDGACVDHSSCPAPPTTPSVTEIITTPPPTCPTGMVFNSCGTSCPLTCDNFRNKSLTCTNQCVAGCFCPRGKVLHHGTCVAPSNCPVPIPTNVQAFCSVVVWDYPYLEDLVEYDIRLIESSSDDAQRKTRTQLPDRPFYVLQEEDKKDVTPSTLFQVRGRTTRMVSRWTESISLGCLEPAEIPTCPACECSSSTTEEQPTPEELISPGLYLKGRYIANNSEAQLSEIGEGEDALFCLTDNEDCCRTFPNRHGQFYYPNGIEVPSKIKAQSHSFYRNRGEQFIRLNRRQGATNIIGLYCCEIPDANNVSQRLCAKLV